MTGEDPAPRPQGSRRGIDRERRLRDQLNHEGWWTCRAAGSLGNADLVALKHGERARLVEVKSTHRGPWHGFGPRRRQDLRVAASLANADAWLVWWPVRKQPQWIPEPEWPNP
jgi:Holliday junction resolvase